MVQGRVFAMTIQDAEATPDVIQGTFYISNFPTRVLIDPGATHLFISHMFTSKLKVESVVLDRMLMVSTPISGALCTDVMYKSCGVEVA